MKISGNLKDLITKLGSSQYLETPNSPAQLFLLHESSRRSISDQPTPSGHTLPETANPTIEFFHNTPMISSTAQVSNLRIRNSPQTKALLEQTNRLLSQQDDETWLALLKADIAGVQPMYGGSYHATMARIDPSTLIVNITVPAIGAIPTRRASSSPGRVGRTLSEKSVLDHWTKVICEIVLGCSIRVHATIPPGFATTIITNGYMTYLDPKTGKHTSLCVASVRLEKDAIESIIPSQLDPASAITFLEGSIAADGPTGGSVPPLGIATPDLMTADPPMVTIRNPHDAEILAASFMQWLGYSDAKEVPVGPDGGIDVNSSKAIAQVKAHMSPIGIAEIQRHYGVAIAASKDGLFFAMDYSKAAVEFADSVKMSLFVFDYTGQVTPHNPSAEQHIAARKTLQLKASPTTPTQVDKAIPGWYADPYRQKRLRYFDGQLWSDHVAD